MDSVANVMKNRLGELEFNLILALAENNELKNKINSLIEENEKLKKEVGNDDDK